MKNIYKTPIIISIIMLLVAIFDLPNGYYTLLRLVLSSTFAYCFWVFKEKEYQHLWWFFLFGLILFNPLIPIHLGKEIWGILDFVTAFLLMAFLLNCYKDFVFKFIRKINFKLTLIVLIFVISIVGLFVSFSFLINKGLLATLKKKDMSSARTFLSLGGKVDWQRDGDFLFNLAFSEEGTVFLNFLFEIGADVKGAVCTRTLLDISVQKGHLPAMKLLLRKGADPNQTICWSSIGERYLCQLPLKLAIQNKNEEMIKMLLANGARVNDIDRGQISPLGYAILSNSLTIVKLLLDKRVELNSPMGYSKSMDMWVAWILQSRLFARKEGPFILPLDLAIANGNIEIVKLLIDYNANFYKGHPVLAAVYSGNLDMLKYLLQIGADIHQGDKVGSPLSLAIQLGNEDMIRYLLESGAKPNGVDKPLLTAIQSKNLIAIKLLKKYGVKMEDNLSLVVYDTSYLRAAIDTLHTDIVREVLSLYGRSIIGSIQWSGIMEYAKQKGSKNIVMFLLNQE